MSNLDNVTNILGEYMLKGWVLTDKSCQTCATPLMRSPRAMAKEVWFCANCDGGPPGTATKKALPEPDVAASTSSSNNSLDYEPSTPPTEVSHLSDMDLDFVLPPETEESRHRREQSDRASAELGRRLLRGWAMLGEECPNTNCYGIPLMRPPNSGDQRSNKKECVSCGNIYETSTGETGEQRLVLVNPPIATSRSEPIGDFSSPSIASIQNPREQVVHAPRESSVIRTTQNPLASNEVALPDIALPNVLLDTSNNLQAALRGLSSNLATMVPANFQNPELISRVANAISDVTQALRHVEQLRRDQSTW